MSLPAVEYHQLGKSGLRVSVPVLGAGSFGSDKWTPFTLNEDKALPLLKAAWDRGVTTFDTANIYSDGESERIIGKFIKQYNIPREKLLILTKCRGLVHEEPTGIVPGVDDVLMDTRDYVNQSGLSRAAIFNAVNASLSRLGTDYIDMLQIHRHDFNVPPEEIMKALHDLVESGKVRYLGASSMRAWQFSELNYIAEKHNWTKFVSMQSEYSLLYREDEREMIPYCKHHGIGLIPWSPLHGGDLARPLGKSTMRSEFTNASPFATKKGESEEAVLKRTEEIAKKRGWKMSQVALAWIGTKVSSPIVGINSIERLEDAIITGKTLTDEEIKYLEEPYVPKPIRAHE